MPTIDEMSNAWWRRITKKSKGKPLPVIILQTRTLSTAVEILTNIQDIPFEKLSMSLYFYCHDVGMKEFTRAYEAQLELAGADPEKFALGLHQFFNKMANTIQKQNLYDNFFEFYYRCVKLRLKNENENVNATVSTAYQNLLVQQMEYLRPSKFDFRTFIAGRKTTGEIMTREDPFPNFDMPVYEFRSAIDQGKKVSNPEEYLYGLYRKAGYDIHNADDHLRYISEDKLHTTTCTTLLPFINEYTFDILPQTIYNANSDIIHRVMVNVDLPELKEALKHRKRTLPTNGVRITFTGAEIFSEILLKEILYDNSIYMLYRLNSVNGDICGVYETRDSFFYGIFIASEAHGYLEARMESMILYLYATQVLGGSYQLSDINRYVMIEGCEHITAEGFGLGGKLRNVYDGIQRPRNGDYESAEASIQGYVRKLPAGQKASEEARTLAENLGYDLEPNETYVRPFIRQVFRLKERTETAGTTMV